MLVLCTYARPVEFMKFIRSWLYQNHHIQTHTALLCDDPYKLRMNELTEKVDNCVLNSNLNDNKLELQKLQNMNQKKGEESDSMVKCESEKTSLIKHIQEVKFQVKGTRDHLKQCQESLQEESEDLEFERNVKLQECGLGKPLRTNYRDYITKGSGVAGLVGGAGMSVFFVGHMIYLSDGYVQDILLTLFFCSYSRRYFKY